MKKTDAVGRVLSLAVLCLALSVAPLWAGAESEIPTRMEAYRTALTNWMEKQEWPDGSQCAYDPDFGPMSDNRFAIHDVDGDGAEELIMSYVSAPVVGEAEKVYGYDEMSGRFVEKFSGFPAVAYLTGGFIQEYWSHNQGYAGENDWPYTILRYDPVKEQYEVVAWVDSWDRSISDTYFDGTPFPEDIDTESEGVVYFLGEGEDSQTISRQTLNAWRRELMGDAMGLAVRYQPLTAEAIAATGAGTATPTDIQ